MQESHLFNLGNHDMLGLSEQEISNYDQFVRPKLLAFLAGMITARTRKQGRAPENKITSGLIVDW